MKNVLIKLTQRTALKWAKIGTGVAVFTVVVSAQIASMSTPAHALKLYAQQNGNIPCSTCHSRKGLANGTMYPFTRIGKYFKANNQLPPRATPTPTPPPYNPPPVVSPPPYNPPPVAPPPYNPPPVVSPPPYNPPPVARRWTCAQAQTHLRNNAYSRISVRDCRGSVYKFTASQSGRRYSLSMKSATGRIYNVRRISRPVAPPIYNPPPVAAPPIYNPPPVARRLTCRQAQRVLRNQGYSRIRTRDCRGRNYTFEANRGGQRFNIRMRAANGRIYRVRRVQVFNPAPPVLRPPVIRGKLTCNQAARKIRNLGYRNVVAKDCSGNRYTFHGISRGVWYRLRIRATNGNVYKITRGAP